MEQKINEKLEIKDMIYTIRGKQVMLDFDLAKLLGYETKRLKEQVKRNINKFVDDSVFQLTLDEAKSLQGRKNASLNGGSEGKGTNLKYAPYALTMQAVEVLGTILRKNDAQKTIKEILQTFSNESSDSMLVMSENTDDIKRLIYMIRGEHVMLDNDLAAIYGYEVKNLNRQVKNNIEKFPGDMMFQLTNEELQNLKCKNCTSSWSEHGGQRKLPNVFTEQGIYMLATVLKGELATKQTLLIIRTFRQMRHYFTEKKQLVDMSTTTTLSIEVGKLSEQSKEQREVLTKHEDRLNEVDSNLHEVNLQIAEFMNGFINNSQINQWVFVDNQKFEADEAYIYIYKQAKESIFVIDDYVSIKTLSHLKHKNTNVQVILFSDNKAKGEKLTSIEIDDFNSQYPFLCLYPTHKLAHDRLIVLDYGTSDEVIYHCGASSKDAGNRFCSILKVYDPLGFRGVINKLFNT